MNAQPTATTPPRRTPRGRARSLIAITAAGLTIAALAAVLAQLAAGRSDAPRASATATPPASLTATDGQPGRWTPVAGLSGGAQPHLAPGDPRVAYEAIGAALRRTDDAGATWRDLPFPGGPQAQAPTYLGVAISPLDAHALYLTYTLANSSPPDCPDGANAPAGAARTALDARAPLAGRPTCPFQYFSADGGEHWSAPRLPVPGILGDHLPNQSALDGRAPRLQAQGDRLYAAVVPLSAWVTGNAYGGRLVASADGGASWQLADATLRDHGQVIYDFAAAPTGVTVFAVTESVNAPSPEDSTPPTLQVWHTSDAGAHWSLVGAPPRNAEAALRAADGGGGTAGPALYLFNFDPAHAAPPLWASADGGRTWAAAPTRGLAAGFAPQEGLGPVLADGSLVLPFSSGDGDQAQAALYGWRAGEAGWRQLAPPVGGSIVDVVATPPDASDAQTLVIVLATGSGVSTQHCRLLPPATATPSGSG